MSGALDALSHAERLRFLANLSFLLTIDARAVAYECTAAEAAKSLRAFNEMQHQVSQHQRHEIWEAPADQRYPDDAFFAILRELAEQIGWTGLDDSIGEALATTVRG